MHEQIGYWNAIIPSFKCDLIRRENFSADQFFNSFFFLLLPSPTSYCPLSLLLAAVTGPVMLAKKADMSVLVPFGGSVGRECYKSSTANPVSLETENMIFMMHSASRA